ncbi:MAG: aminopeptidase P family protein [Clostridia bacterium]|nr:aminopeptidase P family protein [Clostridia bacterium]
MKKELEQLKRIIEKRGYDAYVIFTSDDHGSEYVEDHFKARAYFSGFTGSAGTFVVTKDESALWTDGRYFLQAARELSLSGATLMKDGEPSVPSVVEYLKAKKCGRIAFDFSTATSRFVETLKKSMPDASLVDDGNIVDEVWQDRPALPASKAYIIPFEQAGESVASKLENLVKDTKEAGCDFALVSSLDDVAWLFNLRGDDIRYNPVNYAYALVGEGHSILYIDDTKLSEDVQTKFALDKIVLRPYLAVYDDLKALTGKVLIDESKTNYALSLCIKDKKIANVFPTTMRKAIKNEIEIANSKKAQLEDSVAMVKFMRWLKENVGKEKMTEISVADKLETFRKESDKFVSLSFDTICGYMENGAVIHYSATPETDKEVLAKGLLLVDSGAQYLYGTTDITRTYALGEITDEMRRDYTLVLKAHIALARAVFPLNTYGAALDLLTREPMLKEGKNFRHGTGHGVGYLLNVHEGPHNISPRANWQYHTSPFKAGMFVTDEPGVYIENEYGIRHENILLCVDNGTNEYGATLGFEPLTFVPFDLDAIDACALQKDEKAWLNGYHKAVYDKVSPLIDDELKAYLKHATREI